MVYLSYIKRTYINNFNKLIEFQMGFCRQNIKALFLENKHKEIKGNFLCLGRQTVNLDIKELEKLFEKKYNLNSENLDKITKHAKQTKNLPKFSRILALCPTPSPLRFKRVCTAPAPIPRIALANN